MLQWKQSLFFVKEVWRGLDFESMRRSGILIRKILGWCSIFVFFFIIQCRDVNSSDVGFQREVEDQFFEEFEYVMWGGDIEFVVIFL